MREFTVTAEYEDRRLDRWLRAELPALPMGQMQKFLRLKRIKLNGKGAQGDTRLHRGDTLQLYIEDEFFAKPKKIDPFLSKLKPKLDIVYEDAHILIVDKRPGLVAHPDAEEKVHTLLTYAQAYLYQKGEYDSQDERAFAPALCNRIDRFTGGIVLIAKTEEAMRVLNEKIRAREIGKYYLCVIEGRMRPANGTLTGYILKNTKRVTVLKKNAPGAQQAITRYRTMETRDKLSLVECELLTGRTHQIRAQFADTGHPLLGDTQYGSPALNEKYGRKGQALYAYRISFDFTTDAGVLNGLKGKSWHVKRVPFVREYFGEE